MYEVQDIPGKARGIVALVDIPRGTRIMCKRPLFVVPNMPPSILPALVAEKLRGLSEDDQRTFLSLHNALPGSYPLAATTKTNALPCGADAMVGGVYRTICFVNHDCTANAHNN